jgi:uncharacterized membrane protein YraQ (UPF0718 family)
MDRSAALAIGRVFWNASTEILPLFLLALVIGALIEEFVSERTIARFLTGRHPGTMLIASVAGALIPLCTCGMVPLAVSLRRRGGDLKHTFGFLTAGAAVSVPVLLLTWRVIGVEWAWQRFLASVVMGLAVGYASIYFLRGAAARSAMRAPNAGGGTKAAGIPLGLELREAPPKLAARFRSILRRFLMDTREYAPWVLVSLLLAAIVDVAVPGHWIRVLYGQRTTLGTILAALSGFPFYFCSGAELPLLKELLAKGMGAVPALSMMLAVPIVNIPTVGVVGKWLGPGAALRYLTLCATSAALLGLLAAFAAGR